jgi:putative effector of murein hydrolase
MVASLGFLYTLTTVTYSVLAVQKATGTGSSAPGSVSASKISPRATRSARKPLAKTSAPAKAYSDYLANSLFKITAVTGILSLISTSQGLAFDTPLRTIFLSVFTVFAYVWGARLPPSLTKVVHPLVISSGVLLGSIAVLAKLTGVEFLDYLRYYKSGSLSLMKAGPGDILLYLLGPSVVSFAISMYSRRAMLRSNLLVVVTAMLMSSVGGLFGTAAFVRAINLGGKDGSMVRLSVLARNITTALSMAVTAMIGGDISIAASVVVLTGIIGTTYAKTLLTAMGVTDPICRGLAVGCSSQGLGVASISDEPDAFPFAAMSMVLTAVSATTLVSIPVVKKCLIKVATGN